MNIPPELLPVIQITLPLLVGGFIAVYAQNKRFDDLRTDMKEGFDKIDKRLERIEKALTEHGERIAKLEGRIPPLVRN